MIRRAMVLGLGIAISAPALGAVQPPQVILETQKAPIYPPAALAARYEGSVTIETTVLTDGRVGDVRVVECSRPKVGFEEAAMTAVRGWRFEPANEDGRPLSATIRMRLNFILGEGIPRVSVGTLGAGDSASGSAGPTSGGKR